jgi:hypothetical protein
MEKATRRGVLKGLGMMLPMMMGGVAAEGQDGGVTADTVYELRVYHLNVGMEPKILDRFRTAETGIFKRLGMHPVAYWVATDGPALLPVGGGTLIYILRHKSRQAATDAWAKFKVDPEWVALKAETEKNGAFVASQEHTFMTLTDFSPKV